MDIKKVEYQMVTVLPKSAQAQREDTLRLPLVPSEKNNVMPSINKPRAREISSRCSSGNLSASVSSPSTTRRCSSPTATHTKPMIPTLQAKRAQSAERGRPITPLSRVSTPTTRSSRPSTPSSPSSMSMTLRHDTALEMHNRTRRSYSRQNPDGLWPSIRNLSSSLQLESVSVPASKKETMVSIPPSSQTVKPPANCTPQRKRTPLRGRNISNQSENSQPLENSNARFIVQHRRPGTGARMLSANVLLGSVDGRNRVHRSTCPSVPSRGISPKRTAAFDGATRGFQHHSSSEVPKLSTDGSGRTKHVTKLDTNSTSQLSERSSSITKIDTIQSLPIHRGSNRSSSPSNVMRTSLSTSRGMQSPSRTRPSTPIALPGHETSRACTTLSYVVELQREKKTASHTEAAHRLRLQYNVLLQWHFVNDRNCDTFSFQKIRAEKIVYTAWNNISRFRNSVIMRRIEVQHLKRQMKLAMILKEQMAYLDYWAESEREHGSSLSGLLKVLKGSTLHVPVSGCLRADVISVKNAVSSAVDVIQAMGSSISYLLSKVNSTKSMISELSVLVAKERAMLSQCKELLASVILLQVQESSLRTQLIQLSCNTMRSKEEVISHIIEEDAASARLQSNI